MRTTLTEEQSIIQASAMDWLNSNCKFSPHAARAADAANDSSASRWQSFADMGWLGLPFPEDVGGFAAGPVEAGLLMQAFGAHLVAEPFIASVMMAGRLLDSLGTLEQRQRWLPKLIQGSERVAFAHTEEVEASPWAPRATRAKRTAEGWKLQGAKQCVEGGADAAWWLVSADGEDGRAWLFMVSSDAEGVTIDNYRTLDGGVACDLRFDDITVPAENLVGGATLAIEPVLNAVLAEGIVSYCWGAAGLIASLVEQTAEYTRQRKQFGRSLSEFQVVQHRLAEMAVESSEAKATCELASMLLQTGREDPVALASAAKAKVGRAAEYVSKQAVQLHGAMGVCEELPIAASFRWLQAFQLKHGRGSVHAAALGHSLAATDQHKRSIILGRAA